MENKVLQLKQLLAANLTNYFNGNTTKVRDFANMLRQLGLDMDDSNQLQRIIDNSDALVVLLGLTDFGILPKVADMVDILKTGNSNEAQLKKLQQLTANIVRPN